jgi:hypothetical protein
MFRKHYIFKLVAAIAVAASLAVVGARTAKAGNPYNPQAYVYGGASPQVSEAIQAQGYEAVRFATAARALKRARAAHRFSMITDTLGGNGRVQLKLGHGGSRNLIQ